MNKKVRTERDLAQTREGLVRLAELVPRAVVIQLIQKCYAEDLGEHGDEILMSAEAARELQEELTRGSRVEEMVEVADGLLEIAGKTTQELQAEAETCSKGLARAWINMLIPTEDPDPLQPTQLDQHLLRSGPAFPEDDLPTWTDYIASQVVGSGIGREDVPELLRAFSDAVKAKVAEKPKGLLVYTDGDTTITIRKEGDNYLLVFNV